MRNIVLIGFMGTGKTSTGGILAKRMGRGFLDLDEQIEAQAGMSIKEMFARHGEAYFRAQERAMVQSVAKRQNLVISTGGGTVKDPENMRLLRENGEVICLVADVETILERTGREDGTRPLLGKDAPEARRKAVEQLLADRRALYEQADYTVDTSALSPLQVADEIAHHLRRKGVS